MKSLFTSLILLLTLNIQASEVTFIGKVQNQSTESVEFILQTSDLIQEDIIYLARINDKNEFSIVLPIKHSQIVRIKTGDKLLRLYASPKNNRIEFEYDANAPSNTLRLKGNDIFNNSFYNSFSRSFQWNIEKWETYEMGGLKTQVTPETKRMATSYSMYDYFKIVDQNRMNALSYLQNSSSLSIDFYRFIENEINWRYETNKIAYFLFNKDRFSVNDLKRYWVRYSLMQSADINNDSAIPYPSYRNMLNAFIHFLHLQTPVETKIAEAYHTFIRVNLRGKPRYFMLAKLMLDNYRKASNPNLAMENLKAFKRENPFPEFNESLDNIFGKESEFLSQKNAPNMKVLDLNEQEFWLNEYSGKVVYVSFWASWCAPCIKGFNESAAFRKEMENQGVVFLNVNIDKREDIWRKSLSHHNIVGKNVYGLDLKQANDELKITSLPYYFLMNKYGKIDYLSSNKLNECREDFMGFLKE